MLGRRNHSSPGLVAFLLGQVLNTLLVQNQLLDLQPSRRGRAPFRIRRAALKWCAPGKGFCAQMTQRWLE
jgi:hypothetical protein